MNVISWNSTYHHIDHYNRGVSVHHNRQYSPGIEFPTSFLCWVSPFYWITISYSHKLCKTYHRLVHSKSYHIIFGITFCKSLFCRVCTKLPKTFDFWSDSQFFLRRRWIIRTLHTLYQKTLPAFNYHNSYSFSVWKRVYNTSDPINFHRFPRRTTSWSKTPYFHKGVKSAFSLSFTGTEYQVHFPKFQINSPKYKVHFPKHSPKYQIHSAKYSQNYSRDSWVASL